MPDDPSGSGSNGEPGGNDWRRYARDVLLILQATHVASEVLTHIPALSELLSTYF